MGLLQEQQTSNQWQHVPGNSSSNSNSNNRNVDYTNMPKPKKYTKVNGVMKLNPEFKKWTEAQNSHQEAEETSSSPPHPSPIDKALPIVSSMEDHEQLQRNLRRRRSGDSFGRVHQCHD
jgi:hypothetical protein